MPGRPTGPTSSWRAAGGFTFAESPARSAPQARLLWRAVADPLVLAARCRPVAAGAPGAIELGRFAHALTAVREARQLRLSLSDGFRRVRIDLAGDDLALDVPITLTFEIDGLTRIAPSVLALRRLFAFVRNGRFPASLFPILPRIERRIAALRVADALAAGASQREIAAELFGWPVIRSGWDGPSDHARSRLRRLVAEARRMSSGGHWTILRQPGGP